MCSVTINRLLLILFNVEVEVGTTALKAKFSAISITSGSQVTNTSYRPEEVLNGNLEIQKIDRVEFLN